MHRCAQVERVIGKQHERRTHLTAVLQDLTQVQSLKGAVTKYTGATVRRRRDTLECACCCSEGV